MREKREQRIREEQERIAREISAEKERLMALNDKELLIETIIELKKINQNCKTISSKCDDIRSRIALYGN